MLENPVMYDQLLSSIEMNVCVLWYNRIISYRIINSVINRAISRLFNLRGNSLSICGNPYSEVLNDSICHYGLKSFYKTKFSFLRQSNEFD